MVTPLSLCSRCSCCLESPLLSSPPRSCCSQSPAQRRSTYCPWSALCCLSTSTLSVLHSLSGAAVVAHSAVLLCQPVRLGFAHILILSSRHFSLTGNQAWARALCMCGAQCLLAANHLSLRVLGEIQTDSSSQPSLIADSESTYL